MVRSNQTERGAGQRAGRVRGWGRRLLAGLSGYWCGSGVSSVTPAGRGVVRGRMALQVAVLVAVGGSGVPRAMAARHGGAAIPANAAGAASLHVSNIPVGTASFHTVGPVTTVTTGSKNTIINYDYLSVGAGQTLRFAQPTAASRVFNRVTGNVPSAIDGTISSNGIVYLVNPAGITFGQGAVINVGQFFAAASHLSDADFLAGNNQFTGAAAGVVNYGKIEADQVHLTGATVANFGEILTGNGGVVTLTAGKDVFIGETENPAAQTHVLVKVSNDHTQTASGTGVINAGKVSAPAGEIQMGAGDMYAAGIYNTGELKGISISLNSGASSDVTTGKIDAGNAKGAGGSVQVLGDQVTAGGTVDASGASGGGSIRIGGDFHGAGTLPTSSNTTVAAGTLLSADAVKRGDAGSVVVWSNDTTHFDGQISARALGPTGNGGAAEISGKQHLFIGGYADLTSVGGGTGTLLLDPGTVNIVHNTTALFVSNDTFNDSYIVLQLATADLTITTTNASTGSEDLSVAGTANLTYTSGHNLTLIGNNSVSLSGTILNSGTGSITATSGGNVTLQNGAVVGSTGGDVTLQSGGTLALKNNAQVTSQTGTVSLQATAMALQTGGNKAIVSSVNGKVVFGNSAPGSAIGVGTGSQTLQITQAELGDVTAAELDIGVSGSQSGGIFVTAADLTGFNTVKINSDSAAGTVTLDTNSGASIALKGSGAVVINAGTGGIVAASNGAKPEISTTGAVTLNSAGAVGAAAMPIHVSGNVTSVSATAGGGDLVLTGLGALSLGTSSATGSVSVLAGGNITLSGNVSAASNVTLFANGTSSSILSAVGGVSGANIALTATGGIGSTSVPVPLTTTGIVTLNTSGAGSAGDAFIQINGDFDTTNLAFAAFSGTSFGLSATGNLTTSTALGVANNLTLSANGTGGIAVGADLSGGTLTLAAPAGPVVQSAGVLTATTAAVTSGGNITLPDANAVSTYTANSTGSGSIAITNDGDCAVGAAGVVGSGHTVTLTATTGNLGLGGAVTGTTVTLTATAGGLTQSAGVVTATDLAASASGVINLPDANLVSGKFAAASTGGGAISFTNNGGFAVDAVGTVTGATTSGNSVTLTASTGDLTINTDVTGNAVTLAASAGNLTQTAGNISAGSGNVVLTAGGAVTRSGGNLSASGLAVTAGTTASLGSVSVSTLAGSSGGDLSLTNAGALTVGTVGATSDVLASSGNVSLVTSAGDIALTGNVTASAGDATVAAAGNISGSGTVAGNVVTLTAGGDIGSSGTRVHSDSTQLVLSGGNMFVTEANAIGSTAATRIGVAFNGAGDTLDLSAPSINITTAFGNTANPIVLTTTSGGIAAGASGVVAGSTITLTSAAGIGSGSQSVGVSGASVLKLTASGAGIFVASDTALSLGGTDTTVADSAGQTVSLTAPTMATTGAFGAAGVSLVLTTTTADSGLTLNNTISAGDVTVVADEIADGGGGFTATGNLTISPFSSGRDIAITTGVAATMLTVPAAVLVNSSATTVILGDLSQTNNVWVAIWGPAMDLSGMAGDLVIRTAGTVHFQDVLTLKNDTTLTIDHASGVSDPFGSTCLIIGGTTGTVQFTNITGDVGGSGAPIPTQVEQLGGATGTGGLFLDNTGALNITGAVSLTGAASISTHSPLTVSAPVSVAGDLSLTAGNNAVLPGDDLTIGANVHAGGNITLKAGDGVVLQSGNITTTGFVAITGNGENDLTDGGSGSILQLSGSGIQAGSVTANATTGISLTGNNNEFAALTLGNNNSSSAATGNISVTNTGTAGLNLLLHGANQDAAGSSISIITTGSLMQDGAITAANNADLLVKTLNDSGGAITLTNAGNTLGTGNATLQVRNAADSATLGANVGFGTVGAMHIQQVLTSGIITLTAGGTVDQVLADTVGIAGSSLVVNSAGDTTLTNSHNAFTNLTVNDSTAGAASLQYLTDAPGGLVINGWSQNAAGSANITNSSGAILSNQTSSPTLAMGAVTISAQGGVNLTNQTLTLSSLELTNAGGGAVMVTSQSGYTLGNLTQVAGSATTLVAGGNLSVTGAVQGGSTLDITAGGANGTLSLGATSSLAASGTVSLTADHLLIASSATITSTGADVVVQPLTTSSGIAINGVDALGTMAIANASLGQISATRIQLGNGNLTGDITATGILNQATTLRLVTRGNVDLSAATVTLTSGAELQVWRDGTFALGTATLDGGLVEAASTGTGAGGTVFLSGTLTTNGHAVLFGSQVQLTGNAGITTAGGDITFNFSGAASVRGTVGTENLTLAAGAGNITFASPIGAGTQIGTLTVASASDVTLPAATTTAENLTNSGVLTLAGSQVITSGGFVQASATGVMLNGNITTAGSAANSTILFNSPIALGADTALASTTSGNITFQSTIDGAHTLSVTTGGNEIFNGIVGGTTALTNLSTDTSSPGGAAIFNMTAPGVGSTAGVNAGTVSIGDGATFNVASATAGNPTVASANGQTYAGAVVLQQGTFLTSSSAGVTFSSTIDGAQQLVIATSSDTTFSGAVGSSTPVASLTTSGGATVFNAANITTSGSQTYTAVTLQADASLASTSSGVITFTATIDGPRALTVNSAGNRIFSGVVGGSAALTSLTINDVLAGGQTQFNMMAPGAGSAGGVNAGSLTVNDAVIFNVAGGTTANPAVLTTSSQTYNGASTLQRDTVLVNSGSGSISFGAAVDGAHAMTVNSAGNEVFSGVMGGAMALASLTTDSSSPAGEAIFAMTAPGGGKGGVNAGSVSIGDGATFTVSGASAASPSVLTTGSQSYSGAATLGAGTVLASSGSISFGSTIDGAFDLTVNATGNEVFNGVIGGTTPLGVLATDSVAAGGQASFVMAAPASGSAGAVNAASLDIHDVASFATTGSTGVNPTVKTSGTQTYNGTVSLGTGTFLSSTAGNLTFNAAVDGGNPLTVSTPAGIAFNAIVGGSTPLSSLTTLNGTTTIDAASITTGGGQSYSATVLATSATLASTGGGGITFTSTLDGTATLTVSTSGIMVFNGVVGGTSPLTNLATSGGTTVINTSSITTVAYQTYGTVLLDSDTSLRSSPPGSISFNSTLDGAHALTVGQNTLFHGAVGATTPLTSLTVNGAGILFANITTSGSQTYGLISLAANVQLSSTAGGVIALGTINGGNALTVTSGGNIVFDGIVGGSVPLTSLTTLGGATVINTAAITTVGAQSYSPMVLDSDATLAGSAAAFSSIDGPHALTVNCSGDEVFGGIIGGATALTSLTTDAVLPGGKAQFTAAAPTSGPTGAVNAGSVTLNDSVLFAITGGGTATPTVKTSGAQVYNGPITLGTSTWLTSTGSGIAIHSAVDGAHDLTLTASTTVLTGILGGSTPLAGITINGPAVFGPYGAVTSDIVTTGSQAYNGAVTLAADAALNSTGGSITFNSTLDGAHALALGAGEAEVFNGLVGGGTPLSSLLTLSSGTTLLGMTAPGGSLGGVNAGSVSFGNPVSMDVSSASESSPTIRTTGAQTYAAAVALQKGTVLTSAGAGTIAFDSTVDGAQALSLNTAGTIQLTKPFGESTPLASLKTNDPASGISGGAITFTGRGGVTTSGAQNYNGNLVINTDVTLASTGSAGIAILGDVTGTGSLTLITAPSATIADDTTGLLQIGNVTLGGDLAMDAGGAVSIKGRTAGDPVVLAADGIDFTRTNDPIPVLATIFYQGSGLTVAAGAGGLQMAEGQSLAVFNTSAHSGNLTITSGGNLLLGDIAALGKISINAGGNNIAFWNRLPLNLTKSGGQPTAKATGVVSGESIALVGNLTLNPNFSVAGSQNEAWFGSPNAVGDLGAKASAEFIPFNQTVAASDFTGSGGVVVFLPVNGAAPPFELQSVAPRDVQTLQPERATAVSGALRDALRELGVYARDARTDELLDYLLGDALYDDVPHTLTPSLQDTQVAANRLPNAPVLPTVEAYRNLFIIPVLDAHGKQKLDAKGQPLTTSRATAIQTSFLQTYQAYRRAMTSKATPAGFRAFLEAREKSDAKMAQALSYLNQLRDLLGQIEDLGLTQNEFEVSKKVLLSKVRPDNILESDFYSVVTGPSGAKTVAMR